MSVYVVASKVGSDQLADVSIQIMVIASLFLFHSIDIWILIAFLFVLFFE